MLDRSPTPMSRLREEFTLLFGHSGGELVSQIWRRFQLDPLENTPETLRPALAILFVNGARLAALRGEGRALKRIQRDFESDLVALSQASLGPERQRLRRVYLLERERQAKRWTEAYRSAPQCSTR